MVNTGILVRPMSNLICYPLLPGTPLSTANERPSQLLPFLRRIRRQPKQTSRHRIRHHHAQPHPLRRHREWRQRHTRASQTLRTVHRAPRPLVHLRLHHRTDWIHAPRFVEARKDRLDRHLAPIIAMKPAMTTPEPCPCPLDGPWPVCTNWSVETQYARGVSSSPELLPTQISSAAHLPRPICVD